MRLRLALCELAMWPGLALGQAPAPPPPVGVTTLYHDPISGDLMAIKSDGSMVDAGIANQRGNNTFQTFSAAGAQPFVVNCGTNKVMISGTSSVAALTIQLSPCPRINDSLVVSSSVAVGATTFIDPVTGNALASFAMPTPYQSGSLFFGTTWQVFTMPPAAYALTAAMIVAALGYTPVASGSDVTSFNSRSGAVTLSSSDVVAALGYTPLQTAPACPAASPSVSGCALSTAYDTAGLSAAETTRAEAAEALKANTSALSGYLTACPAATGSVSGCSKRFDILGLSITTPAVTLLAGLIAAPVSITAAGVALGDRTVCNFAGSPPSSGAAAFFLIGCQPTAANTLAVQFSTTAALTLGATATTINVTVQR